MLVHTTSVDFGLTLTVPGLRPLELVHERAQTILVVDYTGSEPLDRLIRQPMEIGSFLRLAGIVGRDRTEVSGVPDLNARLDLRKYSAARTEEKQPAPASIRVYTSSRSADTEKTGDCFRPGLSNSIQHGVGRTLTEG